ncbi:MAG TPA: TSUP family transporter [Plasticicumulans sp.]|uniref:TSUP family transporter n=2 Tax=Plasticicumulans sp. TaxID=2307179 RepID=UPI002C0E23DF|nr:TSUP family transporter [Plasticicumulans sp.]HMW30350.1 TSUP family transporter [Plasticicumulans sp.]HMW42192.1 TSUP family transporter [Plasticicumulans sp.]HMX54793.1 TSUP family transporter [Plasticicumulans sp.]HMZ12426.1 TSUP family transporter [Plasticicumulans sp.]HNE00006.1 TSUP family transporter [Plasticicumulans sp.]
MLDLFSADPSLLLMFAVVSFTAGFVDAIAGGGGLLTVPALLSAGIPPHLALGTNKLSATFGSSTASFAFVRKGLFRPADWRAAALATLIGAGFGALLTRAFSADVLKTLLPLSVLGAALYLVWPRRSLRRGEPDPAFRASGRSQWTAGLGIGFYDGFIGPGTGAFWMAVAVKYFRQDLVRGAGLARFMNFLSNAAALLMFALLGNIDWALGLAMGPALMLGAWLGAHSAIRYGSPLIRPMFIAVVVAMTIRLLWVQFAH